MLHIIGYTLGLLTLMAALTQCRNANAHCDTRPVPDTSLVYFVNEAKPEPVKLTRVCF